MAATSEESEASVPNLEDGIEYWKAQPASYDGVLGGYGTGSLPRIDSLGSRLFLLRLYPELSTVPSAIRPLKPNLPSRIRALDVGAGVGRVTSDVLLYLVSDVVILEPVDHLVQEALSRARASAKSLPLAPGQRPWNGIADQTRSVTILQGTLQEFDPLNPHRVVFLDRVGYQSPRLVEDVNAGFDVIWCQWCLGHLSNPDIIVFFQRCHTALRDKDRGRSLIVVKENLCQDNPDGSACIVFDEQDSSLTRSDKAWKHIFHQSGLQLVEEKIQEGLPEGLYVVKMYALR